MSLQPTQREKKATRQATRECPKCERTLLEWEKGPICRDCKLIGERDELKSDHAKLSKLLAKEMKRRIKAEDLLKEINQESALESEGRNYATVQITPSTWEKIKAIALS